MASYLGDMAKLKISAKYKCFTVYSSKCPFQFGSHLYMDKAAGCYSLFVVLFLCVFCLLLYIFCILMSLPKGDTGFPTTYSRNLPTLCMQRRYSAQQRNYDNGVMLVSYDM